MPQTMEKEEKEQLYKRPPDPVETLVTRGTVCEECEKGIPAVTWCVDCDELYCERCKGLCHIMSDAQHHLFYAYPLTGETGNVFRQRKEELEKRKAQQVRWQMDVEADKEKKAAARRRSSMEKYNMTEEQARQLDEYMQGNRSIVAAPTPYKVCTRLASPQSDTLPSST